MKCQNLFSWKNKKNISLSSAELAQRVVKVNEYFVLKNIFKCLLKFLLSMLSIKGTFSLIL